VSAVMNLRVLAPRSWLEIANVSGFENRMHFADLRELVKNKNGSENSFVVSLHS
jgi:hypothetical protein